MAAVNNESLFNTLNQAQKRAVSSQASTVAILAGPGSGKTHTLTSRVVWLVDHVGYQPHDVLVATFTVKAAREMKERIGKALGGGREKRIVLGTFHNRPPAAKAWISKKKAKGTVDEAPAKSGAAKDVESKAFMTCFAEYQQHLERSNLLDYDDLLVRCVELLRRYPSCVSNIQSVLIDEYQDTNGVQYELMKLFAQQNRRITIVGDPDQSIYGWRSAEIRNLFRFLRDFHGTEEISLEENYRSSSSIVDVSLRVIQQDKDRYEKVLMPVHKKGTRPVLRRLKNQMDEADWIVSEIRRAKAMSGGMIKDDDVAILLRSAILSRHVESALGRSGIPYKMIGGFKFYERTEIKVILDYLRIIHQPDNNDALARIINVPKRGIGDATVKSLLEEAEQGSTTLWKLLVKHCRGDRNAKTTIRKQTEQKISGELLKLINNLRTKWVETANGKGFDLVELIQQLLKELGFEKHLEDTYGEDYETRWSNVQEFVALAGEFMKDPSLTEEDALPVISGVEQLHETDVLAKFLANVSLASDKQTDNEDQDKPLVTVSTIHAAKGLEWPMVFIPAVYKGSIPHIRSDDDAEERRLLYVAMTRAQALLYLSCPLYGSHSSNEALQLSPFVEDLSASQFLKRGPSLERPIMQEIGRILRRQLPSEDAIYKGMANMTPIEDNLFPDPTETKETGRSSTGAFSEARQLKRHKTHHISNTGQSDPEKVEGWNAPYSTTMQKSSSFTLPGFTTAGAHHESNPQELLRPKPAPAPGPSRRPVSNRPPAQRTLLGFVVTDHDKSKAVPEALPPLPQPRRVLGQSQSVGNRRNPAYSAQQGMPLLKNGPSGGIEPALTGHKLGSAKMTGRPTNTAASEPLETATPAVKQYACFSSSPTKPKEEEEGEAEVASAEEHTRPASCFHSTTVSAPQAPGYRGVKRPAGLSRESIAPMDRLKKPFKPLTIKRP
ncbi:ATP-dependent DNA helicase srs2 [Apiospora kogelbergensis]|uniref:ATP-dependent DNA helicase srs2 n=1 Tax=Apiospora kogelbergensis TaxID=1337665 RepID=UPI0031328363